jgi:hypothetical protein
MAPLAITPIVTSKGPGRKYIHFSPNFCCHSANGNLVIYWLCCVNIKTIAKQYQFIAPMAIFPKVTLKVPGRKYIHRKTTSLGRWLWNGQISYVVTSKVLVEKKLISAPIFVINHFLLIISLIISLK